MTECALPRRPDFTGNINIINLTRFTPAGLVILAVALIVRGGARQAAAAVPSEEVG